MTAAVPARQMRLSQWHRHTYAKFELKDADAALETMTANPTVSCVPSGRGATGKEGVRTLTSFCPAFRPTWSCCLFPRSSPRSTLSQST
jgi:hypothetical protein